MINKQLINLSSPASSGGNAEQGLILHLDANDVDSYDGDGSEWVDIKDHEYTPATNVSEHFNTVLYTGSGDSTNGQSITGVGFQPDLIWIKGRQSSFNHVLYDSVKGVNSALSSNKTDVEYTNYNRLQSFDEDGFSVRFSPNESYWQVDTNNEPFVAWCFKAGGAPSGSDKVSIDGTSYATMSAAELTDGTEPVDKLSVNTKLGFSIVKYTAPALTADTVAHGLGESPEMIILKSTSVARNWNVFHKDVGLSKNLHLNTADSTSTGEYWTANSSTFSIQDYSSSADWIAYCFASKRGVSKVGSYKGTGAAGNKVYTGFEPAFLLQKETNTSGVNWHIWDNKRDSNPIEKIQVVNTSAAEGTVSSGITFNRDGFTINTTNGSINGSGDNYIYYAVAKNTKAADLTPSTDGEEIEIDLEFDPSNVNYTDSNYSFEQDNTQWNGNADTSSGTHEGEVFMNNYFKSGETGKYYYEIETIKATHATIGFTDPTKYAGGDGTIGGLSKTSFRNNYIFGISNASIYESNGSLQTTSLSTGLNTSGQVNAVAIDVSTRKVWMGTVSSGSITWFNSGNPSNGTNPLFTLPSDWGSYHPVVIDGSYSGSSARYAWYKLYREPTATTLPTGFTQLKGAIKNASLELHLDAASFNGSTETPSTWTDSSGNSNNGTITGATFDAELGNWLNFDGADDYISFPQFDISSNGVFTLEMWVNPASTQNQYANLFDYGHDGSNGFTLQQSNTSTNNYYFYALGVAITFYIPPNQWTQVVVTVDANNIGKFYLDGLLIGTSQNLPVNTTGRTLNIGRWAGGAARYWRGKIGQVRIYSSALSQDQIRQNYNFTKPSYPNGYDGAITGATWNPDGYFDFGSGRDVNLGAANKFELSQITFRFKIRVDGTSAQECILAEYTGGALTLGEFRITREVGEKITVGISNGSPYLFIGTTAAILTTSFKTITVVIDTNLTNADKIKIYDGDSLVSSSIISSSGTIPLGGSVLTRSLNLYLGKRDISSSPQNLNGDIANFKIYDKALTQAEITALYNEGQ